MASPNITITRVEPVEFGNLLYLSLVRLKANDPNRISISIFPIRIQNNEPSVIHINKIRISTYLTLFGSTSLPISIIKSYNTFTQDVDINSTEEAVCDEKYEGLCVNTYQDKLPIEIDEYNTITLNVFKPDTIRIEVFCDNFDSPYEIDYPLVQHKSPVPGNSYIFPASSNDLRENEYWSGSGDTHAAGIQWYGYDLGVRGLDPVTGGFVRFLPGKLGTKNEDFRIWGKPIIAMADGEVMGFTYNVPDNPHVGQGGIPQPVRYPPALVVNHDGRLEVFVIGNTNGLNGRPQIFHSAHNAKWGLWDNHWKNLSESYVGIPGRRNLQSSPSAVVNQDGRLEVFAIGGAGNLCVTWQGFVSPPFGKGMDDSWTSGGFTSLGGNNLQSSPSAVVNQDGRLEVFAIGGDGNLYVIWQESVGGPWNSSGWNYFFPPAYFDIGTTSLSPASEGGGNDFFIRHGNEVVLYAHLQHGSSNPDFLRVGAIVRKGDFLGRAGNSGSSSEPHLHIHSIKEEFPTNPLIGPLRPLPFANCYVADPRDVPPSDSNDPWILVQKHGLSSMRRYEVDALIRPTWYKTGFAEIMKFGISESKFQGEFDKIVSSGYRLEWIDGYNIDGNIFFNVIARPYDGIGWLCRFGLKSDEYQEMFTELTNSGLRLRQIESYLYDDEIRYACIFDQSLGPSITAYHGFSQEEHQNSFNSLTSNGWVPVNISVVSISGSLSYATLYEQKNVGSAMARSFITPDEYQIEFDLNDQQGRKLVYLNSYMHLGELRITAIWHQLTTSNDIVASHGLNGNQLYSQWNSNLENGFLTKAITGYEQGGIHTFAAYWAK